MDPVSAATLAQAVVDILWTLGAPITGVIKSKLVKRRLRKVIARVSSNFVVEHPATAEAMTHSAEAIAHELARLTGSGRPLAPKVLAEEWEASGSLDPADARRYADEYVQGLHDELLKIDGFRPLFVAGATVDAAETLRRMEEAARLGEERIEEATRALAGKDVAAAFYNAANGYVRAARDRLDGDTIGAWRSAFDAHSFVEKAELNGDWRVMERSKELRLAFKELVEERYDEVLSACEAGDRAAAEEAFRALEEGSREFKARVNERLLE